MSNFLWCAEENDVGIFLLFLKFLFGSYLAGIIDLASALTYYHLYNFTAYHSMNHTMSLKDEYFEKIKNGTKTIECRLYDEKRREIKTGDTIEFTNAQNKSETIMCRVVRLYLFPSFAALIAGFPITSLGGENPEQFLSVLQTFCNAENEKKHGVVGIEVTLI